MEKRMETRTVRSCKRYQTLMLKRYRHILRVYRKMGIIKQMFVYYSYRPTTTSGSTQHTHTRSQWRSSKQQQKAIEKKNQFPYCAIECCFPYLLELNDSLCLFQRNHFIFLCTRLCIVLLFDQCSTISLRICWTEWFFCILFPSLFFFLLLLCCLLFVLFKSRDRILTGFNKWMKCFSSSSPQRNAQATSFIEFFCFVFLLF